MRTLGFVAVAAAVLLVSRQPSAASQQCPAPRVSTWAGIRDTLWPLIVHHDSDDTWAHLDAAGLPGQSATWCNPLQDDRAAITAGRTIYLASCVSCHGDLGKGDGPGAAVEDPRPYDFSRPEFAGMRQAPGAAVLYAIVVRGIEGTEMRGVGSETGWWERLAVLAYVTSLPGRDAVGASTAWADTLRARRPTGSPR